MTEPLCDEPNAEQECETCLKKALEIDDANIDALQCLGNLRMLRQKDDEALFLLKKVVEIFDRATGDQAASKTKQQAMVQIQLPSTEFRMQTARFLTELE
eukprot:CAMPEP_0116884268 /NCGR_PEP_ID=MMETSP0463-20121206/17097_1 /TAXON_ID=181622 /ORGANISM="Strombidinopsis sp, Strain SopsisLIS2011" /LENGTH=99 /DNA_ID=CAMNT_0004540477 /DNA_START=496 /DNA_END=795 /DNA_ORIENTATION=+